MTCLSDADIEAIAHGLADRTLPKREWTHAAHFAAALVILSRHGAEAETRMPPLIRAYNEATGTPNTDSSGYHETITLASLRAARAMLRASENAPLSHVMETLMASDLGKSGWLLAYWRKETLFSPDARRGWIEPDLVPLPF
jgi:hypothetical protein